MRVAIYCRVNGEGQSSGYLAEQELELRRFCKEMGVEVVKVLKEVRDGYDPLTRDFNDLVREVAEKKLDGIAAVDLARITRVYDVFERFHEDMRQADGVYVSPELGIAKMKQNWWGFGDFFEVEKEPPAPVR